MREYLNEAKRIETLIEQNKTSFNTLIRLESQRKLIINQIQSLKDERFIKLLYKYYIEQKKLKIIAKEIHFSYQYTREIHTKALFAFEKVYKDYIQTYTGVF